MICIYPVSELYEPRTSILHPALINWVSVEMVNYRIFDVVLINIALSISFYLSLFYFVFYFLFNIRLLISYRHLHKSSQIALLQ